ncbi:TaqI-like C-terminal specificity domain-containing protein [Methylotenera sp.]|uniref:type IIG restriction enzyme/methyltransferase n=1 Tax=Methylotenera sp. TaxID=2051956 RepID=UPI002487F509|nr:TaqI-like C-terminal specificity domain-containing protein [Methylotenera sp.]MDI1298900.1 TaqI-like C-terminal specificity domain-containing protein [Methylotenera sp.]
MKLNKQKPRNFINPLLSRKALDADKFNAFKQALEHYKKSLADQISTNQTEPNIVASALKPFLDSFGYKSEPYSQKGQISIDLAVMQNLKPSVIIEAKMPNSTDMIVEQDLNRKSFQQAIMYFMNERAKDNKALFHIIVTDFNNWFVFDAKDFDRLFWRNSTVKKLYDAHTSKSLLGDTTAEFYQALERELPKLKKDLLDPEEIECAHFNVQLPANEKELTAIYKLLSADCLLKEFNPNDANSLNRDFYTELLYILGLEESKDGGKKIIGRAKNPQNGTLYENISHKLAQYNKPNDFEAVIKLIIIWVNRILFLKLLESQIVKWTGNKDHKFLNPNTLDQYDALETLFFEVLAKPIDKRYVREFDHIPYLNSSLFEVHPDENSGIKVSNLVDNVTIDYYAKTVVKDSNNQRKTGKVSTLPYLLAFLDAFDFANDSDEELVSQSKSLISASVLGLIFEKINGYKDGSFYTPSFITMYMARETITKTIIDKFNAAKGWQCKTLTDLHNKDLEITEANTLINSIKICDPAVGSGHFLVSALNEMLRIKSELGVLVSEDGKRIKDYSLSIENDELIIKSPEGELFEYKKNHTEKTRIQKTLFKEKQLLIENCLFGVDINPNSVNICRLRLWIELLKNAYYKDDGQLDTLPNIDINIKCGNSLISRFGLTDDLDSKTIKAEIQDYKQKVTQYKENIGSKHDVLQSIDAMKAKFQEKLKSGHAVTKALNIKLTEYVKQFSFDGLSKELEMMAFIDLGLRGKQAEMFAIATNEKSQDAKLKEVKTALIKKQEIESGAIYQNAFEWRFEFPEVLNEQGDFVGFDVVIGNPPYGAHLGENDKAFYLNYYKHQDYQLDTYLLFIERSVELLKQNAFLSYIIPNTWLTNLKLRKIREFIISQTYIHEIASYQKSVFDEAVVDTVSVFLKKTTEKNNSIPIKDYASSDDLSRLIAASQSKWADLNGDAINIFMALPTLELKSKIEENNILLGDLFNVVVGLKPYQKGKGKPKQTAETVEKRVFDATFQIDDTYKKLLRGSDITRYETRWDGSRWIKFGEWLAEPRYSANFEANEKVVVRQTGDTIIAALDKEQFVCMNNLHVITAGSSKLELRYLLALLNSKLIDYYHSLLNPEKGEALAEVKKENLARLPIKEAENQKPFVDKIDSIILARQNNQDTSVLEAELDAMVYALYGMSDDEIKLIEGS